MSPFALAPVLGRCLATSAVVVALIAGCSRVADPEEGSSLGIHADADGRRGFKDPSTGNIVVKPVYSAVSGFSYGRAAVCRHTPTAVDPEGMVCGYIDIKGREVIPLQYGAATRFGSGLAGVELNGSWGFIDREGRTVIPFQYRAEVRRSRSTVPSEWPLYSFNEGRAAVRVGDKVGLIDPQGTFVVTPQYDEIGAFSDGRALVRKDGRYGFIDTAGAVTVQLVYDEARSFENGRAAVRAGDYWGFIGTDGTSISPRFTAVILGFLNPAVAVVDVYGRRGVIDRAGRWLVLPRDAEVFPNQDGSVSISAYGLKRTIQMEDPIESHRAPPEPAGRDAARCAALFSILTSDTKLGLSTELTIASLEYQERWRREQESSGERQVTNGDVARAIARERATINRMIGRGDMWTPVFRRCREGLARPSYRLYGLDEEAVRAKMMSGESRLTERPKFSDALVVWGFAAWIRLPDEVRAALLPNEPEPDPEPLPAT
jgi:hypothetical protein